MCLTVLSSCCAEEGWTSLRYMRQALGFSRPWRLASVHRFSPDSYRLHWKVRGLNILFNLVLHSLLQQTKAMPPTRELRSRQPDRTLCYAEELWEPSQLLTGADGPWLPRSPVTCPAGQAGKLLSRLLQGCERRTICTGNSSMKRARYPRLTPE